MKSRPMKGQNAFVIMGILIATAFLVILQTGFTSSFASLNPQCAGFSSSDEWSLPSSSASGTTASSNGQYFWGNDVPVPGSSKYITPDDAARQAALKAQCASNEQWGILNAVMIVFTTIMVVFVGLHLIPILNIGAE